VISFSIRQPITRASFGVNSMFIRVRLPTPVGLH
jgi:hypothetical protein